MEVEIVAEVIGVVLEPIVELSIPVIKEAVSDIPILVEQVEVSSCWWGCGRKTNKTT